MILHSWCSLCSLVSVRSSILFGKDLSLPHDNRWYTWFVPSLLYPALHPHLLLAQTAVLECKNKRVVAFLGHSMYQKVVCITEKSSCLHTKHNKFKVLKTQRSGQRYCNCWWGPKHSSISFKSCKLWCGAFMVRTCLSITCHRCSIRVRSLEAKSTP